MSEGSSPARGRNHKAGQTCDRFHHSVYDICHIKESHILWVLWYWETLKLWDFFLIVCQRGTILWIPLCWHHILWKAVSNLKARRVTGVCEYLTIPNVFKSVRASRNLFTTLMSPFTGYFHLTIFASCAGIDIAMYNHEQNQHWLKHNNPGGLISATLIGLSYLFWAQNASPDIGHNWTWFKNLLMKNKCCIYALRHSKNFLPRINLFKILTFIGAKF